MATIGTFTQTQTGFSGDIATLTIQARKVTIVPETERSGETAPTHRIYLGKAEIGAGWAKVSKVSGTTSRSRSTTRACRLPSTPASSPRRTARPTR